MSQNSHAARERSITDGARTVGASAAAAKGWRNHRAVRWAKTTYTGSWAEDLWDRLVAVDFMNQALMLAATLLLCAVPFIIIAAALSGKTAVSTLSTRLGLSQQAATDVGHLFATSAATSAAITGASWVFFILSGIAAASTIQSLYQKVFQLGRGKWDKLCALLWLAMSVGLASAGTGIGRGFYKSEPVLWWMVNVPAFIVYWWFSMWLLVGARIKGRRLLPCAVATGLFWIGMLVFFNFAFSNMVTSSYEEYGPIGVVFGLMSFFIAIGVVITLGAATGMMWRDRGLSVRAVAGRARRAS